MLLPIYWMVATSLKSNKEITQDATLYPHAPTFDNYILLFSDKELRRLLDQLDRGDGCVGCHRARRSARSAPMRSPAFACASGSSARSGSSLLTLRIVPPVVILVPVYLLMLRLKLLNTWLGLIVIYTAFNITFCVWMMESFFREIPVDLEEAAMVDGDSRLTAFRRIALPLARPASPRPRSSR